MARKPSLSPLGLPFRTTSSGQRNKRGTGALWALGATLAISGCCPLHEASEAYREARYPDAAVALRQARQQSLRDGTNRRSARFALYQGLTALALGDEREADLWLSRAWRLRSRHRNLYNLQEQGRLEAAWRSMGRMPGDHPR